MSIYFDTGVLLKIYVPEPNSADVDVLIRKLNEPIPFTHFHEIEIRTALRLKWGRGEITDRQLRGALREIMGDIDARRFEKASYDLVDVFRKAEELSEKYAAATLARTLDILHVAAALTLGATQFITFDARQAALAAKAGLEAR